MTYRMTFLIRIIENQGVFPVIRHKWRMEGV